MEARIEELTGYEDLFEIFNGIDPEAYLMTDDPAMIDIAGGIGTNYHQQQQQQQQQQQKLCDEDTLVDLVMEYSNSPPPGDVTATINEMTKLKRRKVKGEQGAWLAIASPQASGPLGP